MKNVVVRTISGIGFIAVVLGALLWCRFSFAALILWITSAMMYEFFRMTMGKTYWFSRLLTILSACILFLLTFLSRSYECIPSKMVILAVIPVFIVMIDSLYVKDKTEFGKFANLYTAMLYIGIPMALTNLAVISPDGTYSGLTLVCFFAIIWGSDVGADCFGITLGQKYGRKLFPAISPKKSWIGFWGGLLTAVLIAVALHYLGILELPWYHCIILAVLMNVTGVYGDLIESQWKRYYEIKDSGKGIPGHGGYLDRFDSALTSIPMGIIYLELINAL